MRLALFGLTADDVVAVDIELRSETRQAIVGHNRVFYEVDGCEPDEVSAVILHDQEGDMLRVAIHP